MIVPGANNFFNLGLQCLDIVLQRLPGIGFKNDIYPRQNRFGEGSNKFAVLRVQGRTNQFLNLQSNAGSKYIARDIHQTADKFAAAVGSHKQAHHIALVYAGHASSHLEQLIAVRQK